MLHGRSPQWLFVKEVDLIRPPKPLENGRRNYAMSALPPKADMKLPMSVILSLSKFEE
jgi:hypothetical protein